MVLYTEPLSLLFYLFFIAFEISAWEVFFLALTCIEAGVLDGVEHFLLPGVPYYFLRLKRSRFLGEKNSNSIFPTKPALQVSSARSCTQEILREPLENQGQLCKVCRHVGSKSFFEYPFFFTFSIETSPSPFYLKYLLVSADDKHHSLIPQEATPI